MADGVELGVAKASSSAAVEHYHDDIPAKCPPEKAKAQDGTIVYRLAEGERLVQSDLITYYEREPQKYRDNCKAFGLSVFVKIEDAVAAADKVPIGEYVFSCELRPEFGRLQYTKSSHLDGHYTFWVASKHKTVELFKLVNHVDKLRG